MAVDRFTRFKILRALWARAKNLLAWLHGPRERDQRLRAQYWQQVNVAQRQLRDGVIRGTGDPDSVLRPPTPERGGPSLTRGPVATDASWWAQREAQRAWFAAQDRAQRDQQHRQQRNGRR
jgi:hypothetical protein